MKPIYPRLLNGAIILVIPTGEKYQAHFCNISHTYEFKHLQNHQEMHLNNCAKDKTKTELEVAELLKLGIIKMVSIPSIYIEIWK